MSDIKKDVKATVKIFIQLFISILARESTKIMVKNLKPSQKKKFEEKVKYMSDDELAQYYDKNPYFEYVLRNIITPAYNFQPAKRTESLVEKLKSIFGTIIPFNNPIIALFLPTRRAVFTAISIILITATASIGIIIYLPPVANFTTNTTNGAVPLMVQFNDTSTGGKPISWDWDFGDNESSTNRNLTHTYNSAGNYTVKLTVTNIKGSNSTNATINVSKVSPNVSWSNPSDIVYGTPLSKTQLNAMASVNGTYNYNPAEGTVLELGSKTLYVTFIPTDTKNYTNVSMNVSINVKIAKPEVNWNNPDDIIYGTPLSDYQLNAKANVHGKFSYEPVAGTKLSAGPHTLHVEFAPEDANYINASKDVTINVSQARPIISWSNPSDIVYGTPLNGTQLNAKANVEGTYNYTLADETKIKEGVTVLKRGKNTLFVDFTPTNSTNYTNESYNVTINVSQAHPIISWSNPSDIVYGTPLNGTQLNAKAHVEGTYNYTLADGTKIVEGITVLKAGKNTLFVDYTPKDRTNYTNESYNVTINVSKAYPIITWSNPPDIVYGTPLNKTQLNPTPNINGTFEYTLFSETFETSKIVEDVTVPTSRENILYAYFTPTDSINYTKCAAEARIRVLRFYAYIPNEGDGTVSVIDTAENKVINTISVGKNPIGVAVNPSATKVYVTNGGDDTVSVIDTAKNKVIKTISVGKNPIGVAVSPDGKYAYVAINDEATVSVIDTAEDKVIKTISVGKNPIGVAVSPEGGYVYVTSDSGSSTDFSLYRIETVNNDVRYFRIRSFTQGIVVSPDGDYVYAANDMALVIIDSTTDLTTRDRIYYVDVQDFTYGVAVSPDGTKVYLPRCNNGNVAVVDTATRNVTVTKVTVGTSYGVSVTSDGKYLYVVNKDSGTVIVIDTKTYGKVKTINVGKGPKALGQFIGKLPIFPPPP